MKNYKYILSTIILMLILITGFFTGCNVQKKNIYYMANTTYDFGNTRGSEILKTTFNIKNLFGKTIEIKEIKSSCGCVKATTFKTSLKPNEIIEMEVVFNTEGLINKQKKSIAILIETDNEIDKNILFSVETFIVE